MSKKANVPEKVGAVLRKIGADPATAGWDCHGTYVLLHKTLERVAAEMGVKFDPPEILVNDIENRRVAILVSGWLNGREEWSIGEAAEYNNKNTYPYAMAEKRAKDRVILKLVGLHGDVYSEDEADDYNQRNEIYKEEANTNSKKEWVEYMKLLRDNIDWCYNAAAHIANEDWYALAGQWRDIDEETMSKLFIATSNGGFFTTKEREKCKINPEFSKARKDIANGH